MKTRTLNINQTDVTDEAVLYTCFGVGTCIALFLNDRMTGLAGGAHIPIPKECEGELRSGQVMLEELLEKFRSKGSNLACLRAKLAGGAEMFGPNTGVGKDNIESIRRHLINRGIYIAAQDLGGSVPRTARYNTRSGELVISSGEFARIAI